MLRTFSRGTVLAIVLDSFLPIHHYRAALPKRTRPLPITQIRHTKPFLGVIKGVIIDFFPSDIKRKRVI
jgi:hypothetical protein